MYTTRNATASVQTYSGDAQLCHFHRCSKRTGKSTYALISFPNVGGFHSYNGDIIVLVEGCCCWNVLATFVRRRIGHGGLSLCADDSIKKGVEICHQNLCAPRCTCHDHRLRGIYPKRRVVELATSHHSADGTTRGKKYSCDYM